MDPKDLHVVSSIFNPKGYRSRSLNYYKFIDHMIESKVNINIIECAIKGADFTTAHDSRINQTWVRSNSALWMKENLLNIAINKLPSTVKYLLVADADIEFKDVNWVQKLIETLQKYPVVQAWHKAVDLGPKGMPMPVNHLNEMKHESFAFYYKKFGTVTQEMQMYAHPGYAVAYNMEALRDMGGLFEHAILGGADRYMVTSWIGKHEYWFNENAHSEEFLRYSEKWVNNAYKVVNGNLGHLNCNINHSFHGYKVKRNYLGRKFILKDHAFNPETDIFKNSYGVYEFAGNKPGMEKDISDYFESRQEDEDTHLDQVI
ncbi:MAG: hypothetical protein KGH75_01455 [Rhodospirillales bacterium]|nr:hypothetical protein [Rhodospirillales bacterium]